MLSYSFQSASDRGCTDSFLFAILSPTSLAPDACCSAVTRLSLVLGSFGPAVLRSAWPIGFPHNVVANRAPGIPAGTPPMTPRTPPGPPPSTPSDVLFMVPMTPPELLDHLLPRGKPSSLVLSRLNLSLTVPRAPGPGPITKHDWTPLGKKWLANRRVIFHTDSAKAYKLKLPNVVHDSVLHQKKCVNENGKWQWTKPSSVRMMTHKLPGGKGLKVKCGTQHTA